MSTSAIQPKLSTYSPDPQLKGPELRTQFPTQVQVPQKIAQALVNKGLFPESANVRLGKVFLGAYPDDVRRKTNIANDGLVEPLKDLGQKYGFTVDVDYFYEPWLQDKYVVGGDNKRSESKGFEGGNVLTLTNKQGQNITLIGEDELKELGKGDKAAGLIAASKLFGIPVKNLAEIPQQAGMYFHIDGLMTGFDNGVVGLNSPSMMLKALKAIDTTNLSKLDLMLLKSHIKTTEQTVQAHKSTYESIKKTLIAKGFEVQELPAYSKANEWRQAVGEMYRSLQFIFLDVPKTYKNPEVIKAVNNAAKNPYVQAFLAEFGTEPVDTKNEMRYKEAMGKDYDADPPPLALQMARASYHVVGKYNSQILFANGIGGTDSKGTGYFITNGDLTFPHLNKAFVSSVKNNPATNGATNGIKNVDFLFRECLNFCV
jgi:hypothetical protein